MTCDSTLSTADSDDLVSSEETALVPVTTYNTTPQQSPAVLLDDDKDVIWIEVPRQSDLDDTLWDNPAVKVKLDAEVSFDVGTNWVYAGGFEAFGGTHVRRDGMRAVNSTLRVQVPPGTGRLLRTTITADGTAKTGCRLSYYAKKPSPVPVLPVNGLVFPSNGFTHPGMVAFQFTGANLMPAYPATYIRRYRPVQQTGFYAAMFYAQTDGNFGGSGYYGIHPYPQGGSGGTVHNWEIAIEGGDTIIDDNANSTVVVKDQWYTQALVVRLVNVNEIEAKFYWDLVTSPLRVITHETNPIGDYALTFPPVSPGITIGAAPWEKDFEKLSGTLGSQKFFTEALSEADVIAEAANMAAIMTPAGAASRWWFKPSFADVDDLTDEVTGKVAVWASADKATLVEGI